ncbi:MAG TPA: ADP-glyceromanno-heptose 6-epimerase [Candidatus Sumerlaeota bacterium]|nr:ADP-glyceromanno-heptose 6-epimerase [Candidatus Sumerlaeota bacterium]
MKPIIVTGGAGFIGSNIVAALNQRGIDNITIVDRLGSGEKWKNLRGLRYDNYLDKDEFITAIRTGDKPCKASAIIHMGACSATTERDADYLMRNNYQYTRDLCDWALQHEARFITASSAATYGDGALGYSDEDAVTPTLQPLNMYGYSKQLFDEWALRHNVYTRIVGLKFFNVFGPRETHKGDMRSVAHKAYHELKERHTISLFRSDRAEYADGEQKRDFIYVKDAVDVVLFFLDNPKANGLFNCGTGQAQSWLALARAIFKATGQPENINWIDMPPALVGKYQYFTQADAQKLRAAGYNKPFTPLDDSVADYVRWMKTQG